MGDVKNVHANDLPKIDLLIGGSPCQGFSRAGKGLNFEDPRSALFFEYARVLNEIREINPDVKFLLENVKMKTEWQAVISEHLGVEPIQINSDLFVAQNRERLYWTNITIKNIKPKNVKLIDILENVTPINYVEKDGVKIDKSFSEESKNLVNVANNEVRISQATSKGYIVANNGDDVNLSFPTSKNRRGRVIKNRSSCLDTSCNFGLYHNGFIRRFTIKELERLQTVPDGYTEFLFVAESENSKLPYVRKATDAQRIKALGNGWTVDVIAHIFTGLIDC